MVVRSSLVAPTIPVFTTNGGVVQYQTVFLSVPIPESPVVSGSPLLVAPIPGLALAVPDLPDPVYLLGKAILDPLPPLPDTLQALEADTDGLQLSVAVASEDPIALNAVLDSAHAPTVWNGAGVYVSALLPPHSPGSYQLFATRSRNGRHLRVLTPSHAPARLSWFRLRPFEPGT